MDRTAACQRPLRASRLWRVIQISRFLLRWLVLWLFANFSFAPAVGPVSGRRQNKIGIRYIITDGSSGIRPGVGV